MKKSRSSPEVQERASRMVLEHQKDHGRSCASPFLAQPRGARSGRLVLGRLVQPSPPARVDRLHSTGRSGSRLTSTTSVRHGDVTHINEPPRFPGGIQIASCSWRQSVAPKPTRSPDIGHPVLRTVVEPNGRREFVPSGFPMHR